MSSAVGVLALQGASEAHLRVLASLGVEGRSVRSRAELASVSRLVLPGGESTTLRHLLDLFGLTEPIRTRHRAGDLVLFGTCAGAILLGHIQEARPATLGLLDAVLARNAYGTQRESFLAPIELAPEAFPRSATAPGPRVAFIRAPRFGAFGPDVRVLARLGAEPVALEARGLMATTFHPELEGTQLFHARFLGLEPARLSA